MAVPAEQSFDYRPVSKFHKEFPDLHPSEHALRWEIRHRHQNGMLDQEVVLERWNPDSTRPKILISPTRYFAWLRRQSRRGVA